MQESRIPFTDADSPYREVLRSGARCEDGKALLDISDWFGGVIHLDPKTGTPLPRSLSDFLEDVHEGRKDTIGYPKDRISHIVEHAGAALLHVFDAMRTRVERKHEMVPIHSAKEFDSASIGWLSRLSGKTVREKLSGKRTLMAVKRRMSVDTSENRLVAAFVRQFGELLGYRMEAFPYQSEDERHLQMSMEHWSRDSDTLDIGHWTNLPPNNILLQDRHYRKIWDAWLWTQGLGDAIHRDHERLSVDWTSVLFWKIAANAYQRHSVRIPEQPCLFDYVQYDIRPLLKLVEGIYVPPKDIGTVIRLGVDRVGAGFGGLRCPDGVHARFLERDFLEPGDYRSTAVGDSLRFNLARTDNGWKALRIENGKRPRGGNGVHFKIVRSSDLVITVTLGDDAHQVVVSADCRLGHQQCVKVDSAIHLGPRSVEAAEAIATEVLDKVFGSVGLREPHSQVQLSEYRSKHTVVDLTTVKPRYSDRTGSSFIPFRMALQYWPNDRDADIQVDLSVSKAIALNGAQTSVSILDVLYGRESLSPRLLGQSARAFSESLSKYLGRAELTYLVPDGADDFNLGYIRRSLNSCFRSAQPLPRSIATLFAWVASPSKPRQLSPGDCVLVIDKAGDSVCVTPITSYLHPGQELVNSVPESGGICWIKHPSYRGGSDGASLDSARALLASHGCPNPDQVASLVGLQGLFDFAGQLSFVFENGRWYTPPSGTNLVLPRKESSFLTRVVLNAVASIRKKLDPGRAIHLLVAGDPSDGGSLGIAARTLESAGICSPLQIDDVARGGDIFVRWQEKVDGESKSDDVLLWKEHLPDLSIRVVDMQTQRPRRVYLVKGGAAIPRRGVAVEIPIQDIFELPAGQEQCVFPLQQGEEGRELKFRAVLDHPAFPLEKPVRVRLRMTYTYGSDNPYELLFLPISSETLKDEIPYIRAQWIESGVVATAEILAPDFPAVHTWTELQNYPSKRGGDQNLLDWLLKQLTRTSRDYRTLEFGSFADSARVTSLAEGMRKGLRFPAMMIWSNGRSIRDLQCPIEFADFIKRILPDIWVWGSQVAGLVEANPNREDLSRLSNEILMFLCCSQVDSSDHLAKRIQSRFENSYRDIKKLSKCYQQLAIAIGNGDREWQREILRALVQKVEEHPSERISEFYLQMLGIGLWRSESLLHTLSQAQLKAVVTSLGHCLDRIKFDAPKGVKEDVGKKMGQMAFRVSRFLELLLALLRTRKSNDPDIASVLAAGSAHSNEYLHRIEDLTQRIFDAEINIQSRITLNVDKPEIFTNTPDLIYALDLYLSGDSGANNIRVTAIDDAGG